MSPLFQPYSLTGSNPNGWAREQYAVRFGGCGGKVIARDWRLSRDQAAELCWLLQEAFELGAKQRSLRLDGPEPQELAA